MTLKFTPNRGAAALSLNAMVRGPQGAAATISAGTTTTAAEGTSATVSNSGTTSVAVFDFSIPRGAVPAIGFNFSTTTTDSDPGAGVVRFNNATPASVTTIYFDNADRDGNTVTTWLDSFDDSTTTTKGTLVITPAASPSAKLVYSVSGSVVDGTGYRKVTVSHVSGTTLPSNAAHLAFGFSRTGDKGADGSGTFPGSSTDNAIVRFDGAAGSTVQNSVVTIADTTGVIAGTQGVTFSGSASGTTSLVPTAAASGTLTLPAATDTLVGKATTDTLTNKTLTSPTLTTPVLGTPTSGTLTNCTGLPVAGITSSTSTALGVGSIELGHASDTTLSRSAAGVLAVEGVPVMSTGKHTIWIPAAAMWARTTNGPGAAARELTTGGDVMIKGWAFDTSTEEGVQFYIAFPKSWDKSTVTFQAYWTNASGLATETVSWGLSAGAYTDDDAIDTTDFGTEVRVSDTFLAQGDMHVTAESSAVTVGNTPINDDLVIGQIVRSVANDNMTGDAELLGVKIFYTTNASTDA